MAGERGAAAEWGDWVKNSNIDPISKEKGIIMSQIHNLLVKNKLVECEEIITSLDVESYNLGLLVTYLIATMYSNDKLVCRAEFYDKIRARYVRELGEKEANTMLYSLK